MKVGNDLIFIYTLIKIFSLLYTIMEQVEHKEITEDDIQSLLQTISPLNLAIENQEISCLNILTEGNISIVSSYDSDDSDNTTRSLKYPRNINSPSMSISSSNANIDKVLMMDTIDDLREENSQLNIKVLNLKEENRILQDENKILYGNYEDIKQKYEEELIERYITHSVKEPDSQIGFYVVIIGTSITTCAAIALKFLKVI